jgi:replicative DNA helicase
MQGVPELVARLMNRIEDSHYAAEGENAFLDTNVLTHFSGIDALTMGFQQGSLVVLSGCTGMGKTALALNIARNISVVGSKPVLFCAYETPPSELILRILASVSEIESGRIRLSQLSNAEWTRLGEAIASIGSAPLFFLDRNDCSIEAIRQHCISLRNKGCGAPQVLFLDNLQLFADAVYNDNENFGQLLRGLKKLASELQLCIVLLYQSLPHAELRSDHRPRLNDLPNIMAIQNYADIITVLNREEYWNSDSALCGHAELIFYKNINSPVGTVGLYFEPQYSRFLSTPAMDEVDKGSEKKIRVSLNIKLELLARVDQLCGQLNLGSRTEVINRLLEELLIHPNTDKEDV